MCRGLFVPSISNVVASVMVHDDILKNIKWKRCSKKHETIVEGHKQIHVRIHDIFNQTHIHIYIYIHIHITCTYQTDLFVSVLLCQSDAISNKRG